MAGQLTVSLGWQYENGLDNFPFTNTNSTIVVTGTPRVAKRTTISHTAETTINLSAEVPTPGWCRITNLDAANPVKIGPATGVYMLSLAAGEVQLVRLLSTQANLYALATTADVDILLEVLSA